MSNRVTQSMLNTQLLRNLSNNLGRFENLQSQYSTGKRINSPSDDPVGVSFSLRYRSEISANDQYQKNVDSSLSWVSFADKMLEQVGSVLHKARELAVQGANGTNPQEALNNIAAEVDQLYQQMVSVGNSKFNSKFVFNGEQTNVQPYTDASALVVSTDTERITFEIGYNVMMDVSVTGNEVFGVPDIDPITGEVGPNPNAFQMLKQFSELLRSGDSRGVSDMIGTIDERLDKVLAIRADIGAKTNRIELMESRLTDISLNLMNLQSKNEDADMVAVITNLKTEENVYQASLAAGTRLISPSLLDFLR